MPCEDWRAATAGEMTPLYAQERARWLGDLAWDTQGRPGRSSSREDARAGFRASSSGRPGTASPAGASSRSDRGTAHVGMRRRGPRRGRARPARPGARGAGDGLRPPFPGVPLSSQSGRRGGAPAPAVHHQLTTPAVVSALPPRWRARRAGIPWPAAGVPTTWRGSSGSSPGPTPGPPSPRRSRQRAGWKSGCRTSAR